MRHGEVLMLLDSGVQIRFVSFSMDSFNAQRDSRSNPRRRAPPPRGFRLVCRNGVGIRSVWLSIQVLNCSPTPRELPDLAIETLRLIIDLCVELSVTSASVAPFPLFLRV